MRRDRAPEALGEGTRGGIVLDAHGKRQFALEDKIDASVPLIIAGGSMGGQASLLYTRYSSHPITACFANFPVCDVEYHFTERPDLPATMRYAYRDYPGTFARR